jgi:preprotein translocase subunit SecA
MAGRGTDILLGGNAEFIAKQESLKKGLAQPVQITAGAVQARPDDPTTTYWYYQGAEYRVPTDQWQELVNKYKAETEAEHKQVIASGGLFILGTERHEARRIDNQLRGRAGRQGDPGASRFYLSLEDDLMRIFAKEWVSTLLQRLGMEEGVPIESRMITRRIEAAQKAVEAQHFEARKHLLEYDDVMNKQREAVYGLRRQLLEGLEQKEMIQQDYVRDILGGLLDKYAGENVHPEDWDIAGLKNEVFTRFGVDILAEGVHPEKLNRQELGDAVFAKLLERYDAKEQLIGADAMRHHERIVMLSVLDQLWTDHLLGMDHLKEGIGLRGYGQKDPLVEYKRESFDMFEAMMERFEEETVRFLYLMQVMDANEAERQRQQQEEADKQAQFAAAADARGGNGDHPRKRRAQTSIDDMDWNKRGWPAPAMRSRCSRWCARERRSGVTIPVLAAQARNSRSAAGRSSQHIEHRSWPGLLSARLSCAMVSPGGGVKINPADKNAPCRCYEHRTRRKLLLPNEEAKRSRIQRTTTTG